MVKSGVLIIDCEWFVGDFRLREKITSYQAVYKLYLLKLYKAIQKIYI